MSKTPPVPPDQQSDKIRGRSSPPDRDPEVSTDPSRDKSQVNLDQQGSTANLRQNLTHHQNIGRTP